MAKQKTGHGKHICRSRRHYSAYWLLLVIGVVVGGFALQSLALWLPSWPWALGFAANATVWPLLQAMFSILLLGVAAGFYYLARRPAAIVFCLFSVVTIMPVIMMFASWHNYAGEQDLTLDVGQQVYMTRGANPPDETFEYGRAGEHSLLLSAYFNPDISKRSPAVIYVHGGGWSGGSRTENGELFRWLNSHGYSVFSIDYRYATDSYASWRDAPRDVVCALTWLKQTADVQHVDPGNVTLMGDSAGGQLALRAAYGVSSGDVTSSCGGEPVRVEKVVGIVPAIDFRELYDDPNRGPTSRANVVRYLGGAPDTASEAYTESSILTHVKAGLLPTLLINAANDTLVSPGSGERLATALNATGVDAQQYTLPYAAHSYWINPGGYQNQLSRQMIERFLTE